VVGQPSLGAHDGAHASEIGEEVERVAPDLEGESGERIEPRLPRLLLEAIARNEAQ
jgi:hypothetical protein